ncbi:hypothetical protein [Nostoc sp.]
MAFTDNGEQTAEALENQLYQLQQELGDNSDTQLQSLMSFLH